MPLFLYPYLLVLHSYECSAFAYLMCFCSPSSAVKIYIFIENVSGCKYNKFTKISYRNPLEISS